jgi:hypothetical protein
MVLMTRLIFRRVCHTINSDTHSVSPKPAAHDDMNHSLAVYYNINQSNSDQSRSPDATTRLNGLSGMNRDSSGDIDDGSLKSDKQAMLPLPKDFVPGDNDVICGRGKK